MKKVKVGLVQMACEQDIEANMAKAIAGIKEAAQKGAQIVCLQELFGSLYFCDIESQQNFKYAEAIPGNTTAILGQVAKQYNVVIIASMFEKRAPGLYHNTTAVLDADGSYLGKYRKMHIPDDPGYFEKYYFTPGDAQHFSESETEIDKTGYRIFETKFAKIGVLICWDQWYPEAARITTLKGAEILFYPTAIGWDMNETDPNANREQYQAWQTIQRSHAIANGLHVVAVNRIGVEAEQQFWGGSFVANPFGTLLYLASHDQAEVHVQEIDLHLTEHYRSTWPFLRDRRVDSYQPILNRFGD